MTPRELDPLLIDLRAAIRALDPVPARLYAAARAAYGWRTVDAELAELVADSAVAPARRLRTGPSGPRLLTFAAPGRTVELEVMPHDTARELVGQLVPEPSGPVRLTLRRAAGALELSADRHGRFAAYGLRPGPISLLCRPGGRAPLVTSWVTI